MKITCPKCGSDCIKKELSQEDIEENILDQYRYIVYSCSSHDDKSVYKISVNPTGNNFVMETFSSDKYYIQHNFIVGLFTIYDSQSDYTDTIYENDWSAQDFNLSSVPKLMTSNEEVENFFMLQ